MKIQTNTAANSALGYMKINAQNTERSIQKLSSGFRINRAADDAAGLAIANQLRADGKTLGQAQKNAAQASAMLQIADGAASTLGNIFDRMRELASQGASANVGASSNAQKLQDEWNALYSEADRIIKGTSYQGTNVLTGLKSSVAASAVAGTAASFSGADITAAGGITTSIANGQYQIKDSGTTGKLEIWTTGTGAAKIATSNAVVSAGAGVVTFDNGMTLTKAAGYTAYTAAVAASNGTGAAKTGDAVMTAANGFASAASTANTTLNGDYTLTQDGAGNVTLTSVSNPALTQTLSGIADGVQTLTFTNLTVSITTNASFKATAGNKTLDGGKITISGATMGSAAVASSANTETFSVTGQTAATTAKSAPTILVGTSASQLNGTVAAGAAAYQSADSISLDLGDLSSGSIQDLNGTAAYFGTGGTGSQVDLTTTAGAQNALARLDKAEATLNTFVGKLGAAESRVDYASQNVDSMLQNTQAAESSIRDADMAQEMSTYTKNNILQQAAQSMLAQANQNQQGILQLLRG